MSVKVVQVYADAVCAVAGSNAKKGFEISVNFGEEMAHIEARSEAFIHVLYPNPNPKKGKLQNMRVSFTRGVPFKGFSGEHGDC